MFATPFCLLFPLFYVFLLGQTLPEHPTCPVLVIIRPNIRLPTLLFQLSPLRRGPFVFSRFFFAFLALLPHVVSGKRSFLPPTCVSPSSPMKYSFTTLMETPPFSPRVCPPLVLLDAYGVFYEVYASLRVTKPAFFFFSLLIGLWFTPSWSRLRSLDLVLGFFVPPLPSSRDWLQS